MGYFKIRASRPEWAPVALRGDWQSTPLGYLTQARNIARNHHKPEQHTICYHLPLIPEVLNMDRQDPLLPDEVTDGMQSRSFETGSPLCFAG
jgi:hypothetical protein